MSSIRARHLLFALGAVVLFSVFTPDLWAQEAVDPTVETAAVPQKTTLMDMVIGGGVFMLPIGLLSLWMVTLAVFVALQLSKKRFTPPALKAEIMACMADVKVRSAIYAAAEDPSFLGRMVASSYPKVDATDPETLGRSKVEEAIADSTVLEIGRTMPLIGYFSVIAQGATMLGLFGTVAGMVLAFDSMGLSGGSDPGALAGNISLALITTAGGLVVAIPSIFLFYIYKNRFNYMVSEAQQIAISGLEAAVAAVNSDQALVRVPEGIAET